MPETSQLTQETAIAFAFLGGEKTFAHPVCTDLEAHDMLLQGMPSSALLHLAVTVPLLNDEANLDKAIGISLRTLQRRKNDGADAVLSVDQSSRTWKFAQILGRATTIFGSKQAAMDWLTQPAIGLSQRKPLDLLATSVGVSAVEDCLTRIDYGVYA